MRPVLLGIVVGIGVLSLTTGCRKLGSSAEAAKNAATAPAELAGDKAADAAPPKAEEQDEDKALHLKPEEVAKLGVSSEPVKAMTHASEASGFGVVVAHETIAQSLADLRTAAAVARQSQAAFERSMRLAGTPGAMPVDSVETAERQATVDKAALDLVRQRLSSAYGQRAPWNGKDGSPLLTSAIAFLMSAETAPRSRPSMFVAMSRTRCTV